MKIAEIYTERKKNNKRIKLTFAYNKNLIKEIKTIPGAMYIYNSKTWILPCNHTSGNKLNQLGFTIITSSELSYYSLDIESILIENNLITIRCDELTKYIISKQFTYFDYKSCFSFGKFDRKKATKIELFYIDNYHIMLPIGFKGDLCNFLRKNPPLKYYFTINDIRKKRKFQNISATTIKNCLGYINLRNYQIDAILAAKFFNQGIIKLLPGTGKTEIFLALCKLMNIKTLILTNSIDLTHQTYERGVKAELDVGIVQGQNMDENHQIIMATVQSSHKLKNDYEMVIVDECHEISQIEYKKLSDKNMLYRFGFSATPFGKDKAKNAIVKQWLGEIIFTIDSKKLQEEKVIAIPNINIMSIDQPKLADEDNSFRRLEKLGIISNDIRNQIIVDICKKKGKKLILVKKIEHGLILQRLLDDNHYFSAFLHGKVPKELRKKVLKTFDESKQDSILIGCKVLKQGISLDNVNHLILAGGGNSYYETIQMLGRGLRGKTKNTVEIYDFIDDTHRILLRHSRERIKDFEKEGFDRIKYQNIQDIYKENYELKHIESENVGNK